MKFETTPLSGAYLISLDRIEDERGFFARLFCSETYQKYGLQSSWKQINNSFSRSRGTLRGLHSQKEPKQEVKLVRCINGAIWDVIVDIRIDSPTYGDWFAAELSADNRTMMYVPKGFAHGFISLTDNAEIIYFVSEEYSREHEVTLRWNDTFHGIQWPMQPIVISDKDCNATDWKGF